MNISSDFLTGGREFPLCSKVNINLVLAVDWSKLSQLSSQTQVDWTVPHCFVLCVGFL